MQKKLHLMSKTQLRGYCDDSKYLKSQTVGMSANDVKENIKYVMESAIVNQIPDDGNVKLDIDNKGIAHIPITGALTNTVTPSAAFNGKAITTYNFISASTELADSDSKVKGITYEINTGGGDVDGVEPAAIAISQAKKPTTARVHSSAQSAGYVLASQANKRVAIGKMSMLGSIGVAAEFKDRSKAEEMAGEKSIILSSTDAPEKRLDITTDKGQAVAIRLMDEVHVAMVQRISDGIGKTPEFISKNFGRGGTMTAERALSVGMIDEIEGVTTQSATSTNLAASAKSTNSGAALVANTDQTGNVSGNSNQKEIMTPEQFKAFLETNQEASAFYQAELKSLATQHNETLAATMASLKEDHETAIEAAKVEASTAIESDKISKADASFIGKIMASAEYGQSVKSCGIDVFTGENDMKMFKILVANADEQNEKFKILQTQKNQQTGLKGEEHELQNVSANDKTTQNNAKALSDSVNQATQVQ